MSDYTLPPLPDHPESCIADQWSPCELSAISAYGHACAEHVRAPLLARIAESDEYVIEANKLLGEQSSEIDHLRAEVDALRADAEWYRENLAVILRIHLTFAIGRYLLACTHGRWSGAEKAQRHDEMCAVYAALAVGRHDVDDLRGEHAFEAVHTRVREATREITDALDEAIGFPVDDPHPDLDLLTGRFFERFHAIAMAEISLGSSAIDAAIAARKGEGSEG